MFNIVQVPLRRFFSNAADIVIPVNNEHVFLPEKSWAKTFATGLQKYKIAGKIVLEVGIGCGVNMAGLMTSDNKPLKFSGVDKAAPSIVASQWLSIHHGIPSNIWQSDLLTNVSDETLQETDIIFACIPQVPRDGEIENERDLADYYTRRGVVEDDYGLGLIAGLLDEAASRAPHAKLILNVAERPGSIRINQMFDRHYYKTEIIHKDVVEQDSSTSLITLKAIEENTGINFHFYGDDQAQECISAAEAEERRLAGVPIYHNLCVFEARLG